MVSVKRGYASQVVVKARWNRALFFEFVNEGSLIKSWNQCIEAGKMLSDDDLS